MSQSVKMRQHVERMIARRFILDAIHAGYSIRVYNCDEEFVLEQSVKCKEILNKMFAVDDEYLILYKDGQRAGWVRFIYGNSGWDVISDYATKLEHLMVGPNKISEKFQ